MAILLAVQHSCVFVYTVAVHSRPSLTRLRSVCVCRCTGACQATRRRTAPTRVPTCSATSLSRRRANILRVARTARARALTPSRNKPLPSPQQRPPSPPPSNNNQQPLHPVYSHRNNNNNTINNIYTTSRYPTNSASFTRHRVTRQPCAPLRLCIKLTPTAMPL